MALAAWWPTLFCLIGVSAKYYVVESANNKAYLVNDEKGDLMQRYNAGGGKAAGGGVAVGGASSPASPTKKDGHDYSDEPAPPATAPTDGKAKEPAGKPKPEGGACLTKAGPKPGLPCVFPFYFEGLNKTYTQCTTDAPAGENVMPWCSTKVDEKGWHLSGEWGECSPNCPGVTDGPMPEITCKTKDDNNCILPFSIEGYSFYGCLEITEGERSCYVHEKGNYKNIILATCDDSCPKDELLTNKDLTMEEVLNGLMKKPAVYTKVERNHTCEPMLEEKFKAVSKDKLPAPAKEAKTFMEALGMVCKGAEYCKPGQKCGDYQLTARMNVVNETAKTTPKSDCQIRCANRPGR